jgi:hypothetical protein
LSFEHVDFIARLHKNLYEVSGIEMKPGAETIWMINDSGNKARLYNMNLKGEIVSTLETLVITIANVRILSFLKLLTRLPMKTY